MSRALRLRYGYMAPVIFREEGYSFSFYGGDGKEPPHVHVYYGDGSVKVWLKRPAILVDPKGLNKHEKRKIKRLVEENLPTLLEKWHAFHNT